MYSFQDIVAWHRPRIDVLVHSGVDLLALETFPSSQEAYHVIKFINEEYKDTKLWISFQSKASEKNVNNITRGNIKLLLTLVNSWMYLRRARAYTLLVMNFLY